MQGLLKGSGFAYSENELYDFFEAQQQNEKQRPPIAQAIRFLRQTRGDTQEVLAKKVGTAREILKLWESGESALYAYRLESIKKALTLSDKEAELCFQINFPALDSEWLNQQPAEKRARLLLHGCRLRKGFIRDELSGMLDVDAKSIKNWESGFTEIPPSIIGTIADKLFLSPEKAEQLILLVKPDIIREIGADWLKEKIATHKWDHINFPALDKTWLAVHQPEKERAGLLLAAYRLRKGLKQRELSAKLGLEQTTVSMWEQGITTIPATELGNIIKELSLFTDDAERLALLVRPDIAKETGLEWLREKIDAREYQHINFPALDDTWLALQPEKEKAGLLLAAVRLHAKVKREDMAKTLGVHVARIASWELGIDHIQVTKLGSIINALPFTAEEAEKFCLLLRPDITKYTGPDWLAKKITAKNAEHINYPEFDEAWLAAYQPVNEQAGLLFKAHMDSKDVTADMLAAKLGCHRSTLDKWVAGRDCIPRDKIPTVIKELDISGEQQVHFRSVVDASRSLIAPEIERDRRTATHTDRITARADRQRALSSIAGWKNGLMLEKEFAGGRPKLIAVMENLAEVLVNEFEASGMPRTEAEDTVKNNWVRIDTGHHQSALYASPQAISLLKEEGILKPRSVYKSKLPVQKSHLDHANRSAGNKERN